MESQIHILKTKIEQARNLQDYQGVINAAREILKIASEYPELKIAEFIFLRKIGKAFERLGDNKNALHYFKEALVSAIRLEKANPVDFSKEILTLESKVKHLGSK